MPAVKSITCIKYVGINNNKTTFIRYTFLNSRFVRATRTVTRSSTGENSYTNTSA